ncbi:MAG TPA: hypothetical protein VE715_18860 [Blastocatellia bacterium]|nr:hypothetical protein [Blastocatellia bacterium]
MYCPNCAAPIDGVKFCRSCGSNVSLVPQALSGQIPQSEASEGELHFGARHLGHHHRRKEMGVEDAMTKIFTGVGFVIVAISILTFVPGGAFWWWSFLIPAFALIGKGVGSYLRWQEQQRKQTSLERPGNHPMAYPLPQASAQVDRLSAPTTSELVKPSSVTEHTTRHLE